MSPKRTSRRFQIESLEARQLMAADLYLDFGFAFNWNASQGQHVFQVENHSSVNAPGPDYVPAHLTSLTDAVYARNIGYDQDGILTPWDVSALAQDVVDMVSRIYEPFAVNVKIANAANMNDVIDTLNDHATSDAYIFVAGSHLPDDDALGWALVDTGNTEDNVAFAFAENLLDTAASLADTDEHPWSYVVSTLARTAAHEAAHTFGLGHLLDASEGLTNDQALLGGSDLMFTNDDGRFRYMNLATRWDGLPTAEGTQNAFEVLADNVGLKVDGPAYVTGTGAHDVIVIDRTHILQSQARVTVSAYRDAAHTDLIETQSYFINPANGIIVEAGRRSDVVEVRNLSVPVTLRGGSGDDELIGSSGFDTLEGDTGNDHLVGGGGSDEYLFRGPRYQDFGNDVIDDASGAGDVLDFSQLDFAVNVYLDSTYAQDIGVRLTLDLKTGDGSTGIENVLGTRFDDRIFGNELNNKLFGNAGMDWLYGYDGIDRLFGGAGADILRGGNDRDYLYGEDGRDQLFGDAGNDFLVGGYDGHADSLTGGEGADEFVRYYRWTYLGLTPSKPPKKGLQLVEGEYLADFNSGLGDVIVQSVV